MRNSFSLVVAAASREFAEHRRTQLLRCGAVLGIMLLLYSVLAWVIFGPGNDSEPDIVVKAGWIEGCLFATYFAASILSCVAASLMFPDMTTKSKRIVYLMRPLSTKEKYASQWLTYVAGFWGVFIASSAIAFTTVYAICSIILGAAFSDPALTLNQLSEHVISDIGFEHFHGLTTLLAANLFFASSVYVVGSAFFRTHAFLKTIVATWVVQTVLAILTFVIAKIASVIFQFITFTGSYSIPQLDWQYSAIFWVGLVMMVLMTLFNWWIAYLRFKESDLN